MTDLASILRGDPASGDDYRKALDEMHADGLVLVHRDVLARTAAAGPDDGSGARRLALVALLPVDVDLLAEALVIGMWGERRERRAAA